MNLLITTQAVDLDDPVLAFFHRWIEEFAKHAEHVEVICLKEGRHSLPENVRVHSLGKENGESNVKYVYRFYTYLWQLRGTYDTVFVHMNPEYIVLAGLWWRLMGKKVALWYIHPHSSWRLRVGRFFANVLFSATENSFPLKSEKLIPVGLGVDTEFFSPAESRPPSEKLRVMCTARIAPVKRLECLIDAAIELEKRGVLFAFDYYGEGLPRDAGYTARMRKRAATVSSWTFRGRASLDEIRDAYRAHDVHVNATDSGSFDKAVFESMAAACVTVASNTALKDVLPSELLFKEGDARSLADTLEHVAGMNDLERAALGARLRNLAEERYSLSALIGRIIDAIA